MKSQLQKRLKSATIVAFCVLFFACLAFFIIHTIWSSVESKKLSAEIERLQAAGEPMSVAECIPSPPPAEENAGPQIEEAIELCQTLGELTGERFARQKAAGQQRTQGGQPSTTPRKHTPGDINHRYTTFKNHWWIILEKKAPGYFTKPLILADR